MKKKILSLVLIILIIISMFIVIKSNAYEIDENVKFSLKTDSTKLKAGDILTLEMYIDLSEEKEVESFIAGLVYDKEIFSFNEDDIENNRTTRWNIETIENDGKIWISGDRTEQNGKRSGLVCTIKLGVTKDSEYTKLELIGPASTNGLIDCSNYNGDKIFCNPCYIEVNNNHRATIKYYANTEDTIEDIPETEEIEEGKKYTIARTVLVREGYMFKGWNSMPDGTGNTYLPRKKITVTDDLQLYAQWEEIIEKDELYLLTGIYKIGNNNVNEYEENDKYIYTIIEETTLEEYTKAIYTNGTIKVYKKDGTELTKDEFIGTGMTLEITKDEEKIELQISVDGDLDGNGKTTVTDLSIMNKALLETKILENEYKIAGDFDRNDKITVTDLSELNKIILE